MEKKGTVAEWLETLVDVYGFSVVTLSKYLGLSAEQIGALKDGRIDHLPQETMAQLQKLLEQYSKIGFLYCCGADDKEMKLSAFLKVLLSYHSISKKTIAKMAGVDVTDIDKILRSDKNRVPPEVKFKLAVTVFSLRFFLKELEDGQMPDVSART